MGKSKGEIFLRVGEALREQWAETCDDRKIGQSQAARGLVEWWVQQEPEVQQMVVGALPPKPDLIATVLKRLNAASSKGGPKFDLILIDEDGNPVGEEHDSPPSRGKPPGRGRKA